MNALIQQALSKKAQKHSKISLVTKTIAKPKPISSLSSCTITVDGASMFYTFDGRALFFSEDQEEPIISLPEETRQLLFLNADGETYAFILTGKNKLECCVFTATLTEERYIINRNVIQIIKSQEKIYYVFKKDKNYFINECTFNGKKWIGQNILTVTDGIDIKIYPSNGSFIYTSDSIIHDATGTSLEIYADYVFVYSELMVVGVQKEEYYEIRLMKYKKPYSTVDSFNIKGEDISKIVGHQNLLIFQNGNSLTIVEIDAEKSCFGIKYTSNYTHAIFDYSFVLANNCVYLYILTDSKHFDALDVISGSNIESFKNNIKPISVNISTATCESDVGIPSSIKSEPIIDANCDFFCDSFPIKKSSILREMESMSLTPSNTNEISEPRPKNNLLEDVRAKLNQMKQPISNSSNVSKPVPDRFEIFKSLSSGALPIITNEKASKVSSDVSLNDKKSQIKTEKPSFDNIDPSKINMTDLINSIKHIEKTMDELNQRHKESASMAQPLNLKDDQIKMFLKNIIVESLVPCVEACFNEMKIQMQSELKKLSFTSGKTGENQKIVQIMKYLSSEKPTQAIAEFLKLEEKEIIANLSIFVSSAIENAESNALYRLLTKAYTLLPKAPKSVCFDLICSCLSDIEIDDLPVENLQELSVILRSIKEMESPEKDKCADLNCVIEIISKKIKKRARKDNYK